MPDPRPTDAARILHDRLASAVESEACADCFQHTAGLQPCPICVLLTEALQEAEARGRAAEREARA